MPIRAPQTLLKHPADDAPYAVDFAQLLEEDETLESVTSIEAVPDDGEIDLGAGSIDGTRVVFRVRGGLQDVDYSVTVVVSTSSQNTLAGVGRLRLRDGI
jgi:hypothetical protein